MQFLRYLFVGGTAFLADFGILTILTTWTGFFAQYYLAANCIAFIAGLTLNYLLSVNWVFNRRAVQNRLVELGLFTAIGLVGLCLNSFFIWLFKEVVLPGINLFPEIVLIHGRTIFIWLLSAKLLATGFVYLWNFGARKLTLFR